MNDYNRKQKKVYGAGDWTVNGVDLSPYMMDLGADYLRVAGRVLLFRASHPGGTIATDLVELDREGGFALFRATVTDGEGQVLAVDYGSETRAKFTEFIEKASTIAVGRALANAGFGTQFAAADFHEPEGSKLADAPVSPRESNGTPGTITPEQRRELGAIAKKFEVPPSDVTKMIMDNFGKASSSELSQVEFSELANRLIPDWAAKVAAVRSK